MGGAFGRSAKIGDIEVLRAVAALFVIFHHLSGNLIVWRSHALERIEEHFQLWIGVDLFFAISGFVIARGLLPSLAATKGAGEARRAVLAFWVRRAFRLFPAAWLWLSVSLLACAFFNNSGAFGDLRENLWATLAGVFDYANFRFADKFAHGSYYGVSFVYWSLSLEEQFYLLLPLLALLFRRWLWIPLTLLVLAQFSTMRGPLLMSLRVDAVCLGVLIAIWSFRPSYRAVARWFSGHRRVARAALVLTLLGCATALASSPLQFFRYRIGLIALCCAALALLASFDCDYICPPGAFKRAMVWIGARSYGLYLIHIPVYFATRELWFRLTPPGPLGFDASYTLRFYATAAPLLFLLAALSYRYYETPLRAYGARLAERLRGRSSADHHRALHPAPGVVVAMDDVRPDVADVR